MIHNTVIKLKFKKKIVSIISAMVILANTGVASAAVIKDIDASADYARQSIVSLADKNIIAGDENGYFWPNAELKRSEMVTILIGALKIDTTHLPETPTFRDVPETHWAYKYVEAAYEKGLIKGISPDVFGVDQKITREQAAAIITRSLGLHDESLDGKQRYVNIARLADKYRISEWARDYVEFIMASNLMYGTGNKMFEPQRYIERQQAAVLVDRYMMNMEGVLMMASDIKNSGENYYSYNNEIFQNPYNPASIMVLVNKKHSLPSNYVPQNLVVPKVKFSFSGYDARKQMRLEAAGALEGLFQKAAQDRINLYAISGYRSYSYQKWLFDCNVIKYGSWELANRVSAVPGQSEHQTGLAMDISSPSVGLSLTQAFGDTKEGIWLKANAAEFGFIVRYPRGKEYITGYSYEPWHIRYVGSETAKDIMSQNITFEEYLGA
jgi:LAS superfamily LD-carboxypeptidase LdcB